MYNLIIVTMTQYSTTFMSFISFSRFFFQVLAVVVCRCCGKCFFSFFFLCLLVSCSFPLSLRRRLSSLPPLPLFCFSLPSSSAFPFLTHSLFFAFPLSCSFFVVLVLVLLSCCFFVAVLGSSFFLWL